MANASRQPIRSLQAQMQNTIIVGVIIRSQDSRIIESTKARYNAGSRAVWNFTLRDHINDFINAAVWGSTEFINKLFTTFQIGSVVEVINAKITERKIDDLNEVYVPNVTSPFTLTLNQSTSLIQMHVSPLTERYRSLLRMPTKNPAGAVDLAVILTNSDAIKNQYLDVIVAVTFVSQTREIITKQGELGKIREFEVGDKSTDQTLSLTLWDSEWIRLADKWEPKKTVLFLADAQVVYNDRTKKSALTIVRKTIITENPDIPEAQQIRLSFQSKPDMISSSPFAIPNPNTITKQMTIRDITARINHAFAQTSDERLLLLVVVLAVVDDINSDGCDSSLISERCAKCKRIVANGNESCMNLECPFGSGIKSPMNVISLNILINLRDDTGYLVGCRLRGQAAEQALGCTADELKNMNNDQRSQLKQKLHKKLCKVRMQILGPSTTYQKPVYNILAIEVTEQDDALFEPLDIDDLELDVD